MSQLAMYIPTMQPTYTTSDPIATRLRALAALTNRPTIRRRLPLPTGVEFGGWAVAEILKPQFVRTFGRTLP